MMRGKIDLWSGMWIEEHAPLPERDVAWDMARYAIAGLFCVGLIAVGIWGIAP